MREYRIIKRTYGNGEERFPVQMKEESSAWKSFYTAKTIEEARQIKQERIDRETYSEEVID